MAEKLEDIEAVVRSHQETLKVKDKLLEEKSKAINLLKYKLQSLQKQYASKEGKETKESTADSSSVSRGKMILYKKQLDDTRVSLDQKERENSELRQDVERLSERLRQLEDASLSSSSFLVKSAHEIESLASSSVSQQPQMDKDMENLFAQIVAKDNKIMELDEKCLNLERRLLDLQENLREKDEVLKARNTAIKMMMKNQPSESDFVMDDLELSTKLDEQLDLVKDLRQKLAEAEFEKGNLQLRVMELECNNGSKPPLLDIELERDALKRESDELKQKINDLIGKYDSIELEKERLESANGSLQLQIKQLQSTYNALDGKLSKLQEQIQQKDKVIFEHISAEKNLRSRLDELLQDVKDKDEQVSQLEMQLSDLALRSKSTIAEKESIIANLRIDLDGKEEKLLSEKDEQIEELRDELETRSKELKESLSEASKAKEEIEKLQNLLFEKEESLSQIEKSLQETYQELQQKSEQCDVLREQNQRKEKLIAESESKKEKQGKDTIDNYEKQLLALRKENEGLTAKSKKLEQRLDDILKQRDRSNTKAAELEEDKQELLQRVEELDDSVKSLREDLRKRVDEIGSLQLAVAHSKSDFEQELRQKESKIQSLQEQAKALVDDMQEMESIIASKESLIEELTGKVSSSAHDEDGEEPTKSSLLQRIQELEQLITSREESVRSLSQEKMSLVEKVNQLREELEDVDSREEDLSHQHKKQLNEMKESRQQLQGELESVNEELIKTKAQLEEELKCKADAIDLKLKLQHAEASVEKLSEELERLQSRKEEEISNLKMKLADATVNAEGADRNLRRKSEELEQRIVELEEERNEMEADYAALRESHQICSDEKARLEECSSFQNSKLSGLMEENEELKQNISSLKVSKDKEINILNLKLADFTSNWEALNNNFTEKVSSLSLKLNEAEKERNLLSASLSELRKTCEQYQQEKKTLLDTLNEKDRSIEELNSRLLSSSDAANAPQVDALEEYKKVHAEMKRLAEQKDEEIEFLKTEIQNLVKQLEAEKAEAEGIWVAQRAANQESELKMGKSVQELEQLKTTVGELEKRLSSNAAEIKRLTREKEEAIRESQQEVQELKGQLKSVTAKYEEKAKRLTEQREAAASSHEVDGYRRQIAQLEEQLNAAQLNAFNILADEQNKTQALQNQIAALVSQLEFERIQAREAVLLYEQRIKDATSSQQGVSEVEAKYKSLATKFKLKDREVNQLRSKLSSLEHETSNERDEELESARRKMAELESNASRYEQMLAEESNKRHQVEEEMERLWRITKGNTSTNLVMDDYEDGSESSSRGYLSAIRRLSLRATRNWLRAGPPSRRLRRYAFVALMIYFVVTFIVFIKMCLF